ncbi:unnamed protein product [Orchesella dallaii]|uniref:G-protein coupled receptors family 1 profile domain-containing protein n=1 Tax=Orchesella dallaii TaxID=48710 RepID=A0ABP1S831_9HEXA
MMSSETNLNENLSNDDKDEGFVNLFAKILILGAGFYILMIVGLSCNGVVLYVVCRFRKTNTVTSLFIGNLAVSNIILLFCLVPDLISYTYTPWDLGWFSCKGVQYIKGVATCASAYSVVAISLKRWVTVCHPFMSTITKKQVTVILIVIWIISCFVSLPRLAYFITLKVDANGETVICIEKWPESIQIWQKYNYLAGSFVISYLIPLTTISVCNIGIWYQLYVRGLDQSHSGERRMNMFYQKLKPAVTGMLLAIVLTFGLTWLPHQVSALRWEFRMNTLFEFEAGRISFRSMFAEWLAWSNCITSPLLYTLFDKKFIKCLDTLSRCQEVYPSRVTRRHDTRRKRQPIVHKVPIQNPKLSKHKSS